jgi:hypothetical protein
MSISPNPKPILRENLIVWIVWIILVLLSFDLISSAD